MKQWLGFSWLVLMAAIIGVILILAAHEPRYEGRTLTSWLQQGSDTPLDETQRVQAAQKGIRAIGASKGLPRILGLVEATDDPVSLWLIDKTQKYRTGFLRWKTGEQYSLDDWEKYQWHSGEDFQQLGIAGFEVLGTNAGPAAVELEKLLQSPDHAFTAQRCLVFIGKPAELVFCRALTNQDPDIRQWSVNQLAAVTDDVGVYIDRIKPRLEDASAAVRVTTVDAIGCQTLAPERAVPILVAALKDSAEDVRVHAIDALANFGTNAAVAYPILTNLAGREDKVAGAALRAAVLIAPEQSFGLFTNCLAHDPPGMDAALEAMTEVLPDRTLPMVLLRLQSSDKAIRRKAFGLLSHYPESPQIVAAMKAIALEANSDLAADAKGFLTKEYEAHHPDAVLFPDEPSFQGRRLGEWLTARIEDSHELIPAAKAVLQQAGTNAIPALLKRLAYRWPPDCFGTFQINLDAVGGFIALGEQAKPALPELWRLMDDTNDEVVLAAMLATFGTGANALPFLMKGMTNRFAMVRNEAAHSMAEGIGDKYPERRQQAIRLFVGLLNDPDEDVRGNATNQLKAIDPNAAAKAGIK
jgi:HEAT repeat protein